MTSASRSRLTKSRLLYENPYAYLDESGGYSASDSDERLLAGVEQVKQSRQKHEDPYAHLDETGGFSALVATLSARQAVETNAHAKPIRKGHSLEAIELQVRDLQNQIWLRRDSLLPQGRKASHVDVLNPSIAFNYLGYEHELAETLGQFRRGGKTIEVAGSIDKLTRRIQISRQFSHHIRNFTAAHELGHAVLHEATGLHRDRPSDGSALSRDGVEFEADKFASYFLMPRTILVAAFESRYLCEQFTLDEANSFALGYGDFLALKQKCSSLRQLSTLLASGERFNGIQFVSLANYFRVSVGAMAIRLEELQLVAL